MDTNYFFSIFQCLLKSMCTILCWLWSSYTAYVKRYFVLLYLDLVVNYSEIIDSDGTKAKTMLVLSMVIWNNTQVMGCNFTIQ